jgi:hypothetical protein
VPHGPFAIHPTVHRVQRWTVTHIATGWALSWWCVSATAAHQVADALAPVAPWDMITDPRGAAMQAAVAAGRSCGTAAPLPTMCWRIIR